MQFNVYQKIGILALCGLLPFIPSAMASNQVDGATVTSKELTGLDKYRGATELSATELEIGRAHV